jgi:hypothetical protein
MLEKATGITVDSMARLLQVQETKMTAPSIERNLKRSINDVN